MEIRWLEDFICVVEKGHFARAASERCMTQSALSRRIQSLETWVGTELLDRSQHPIQLTPAGQEFIKYSREILSKAYEARAVSREFSRVENSTIRIACLHTLALQFIPELIQSLKNEVGEFAAVVVAETRTIEEYLNGLYNGNSDFFICYNHPAISLNVDATAFPRVDIDSHAIRAYVSDKKNDLFNIDLDTTQDELPYLSYSDYTYLSRVVNHILDRTPFKSQLRTVYQASLAESLANATKRGMGLAWLPDTLVSSDDSLKALDNRWSATMSVSVYRSASNQRALVDALWTAFEVMGQTR